MAFLRNETHKVKELNKEVKRMIKEEQIQYKGKVENKFTSGNVRDEWRGLNIMMGRQQKQIQLVDDDPHIFVNNLNAFYSRFDNIIGVNNVDNDTLIESKPTRIEVREVTKVLCRIKTYKATSPDGLKGIVLKECAEQLGHVCTRLFQIFLDDGFVPAAWKNTIVIPVPKTSQAKALKDFLLDIYSVQVHGVYIMKIIDVIN